MGLELEVAGSELTNPETAETFSRVLGKPVKFQQLPMPLVSSRAGQRALPDVPLVESGRF